MRGGEEKQRVVESSMMPWSYTKMSRSISC